MYLSKYFAGLSAVLLCVAALPQPMPAPTPAAIYEIVERAPEPTLEPRQGDGCTFQTTTLAATPTSTITDCVCGSTLIAGINFAVSGTATTSYCATGTAPPAGFTQVPYGPGAPAWATDLEPAAPCADPTIPDASCWQALDLTGYVNWWWPANNASCGPLGFADCYYARAVPKYSPSTCAQINEDSGCKEPAWGDFQGLWNGQRAFYVAWNIWNLNGLFANYYQAIFNAQSTVTNELQTIIDTIDPVQTVNAGLDDILTALTVGLAFIPEFEAAGALIKGIIIAAQQAPGVAKYIFPTGTSDSETFDFKQISASLGTLVTQFKTNYAAGLAEAENDVTSFLAFVENTPLSGKIPDLNSVVDQCLQSLYTYVISQAYQVSNVIITRQVDTDVNALSSNGTALNWPTGCGKGYGQYGECSTFWYDQPTDVTYGLYDTQKQTKDFNLEYQQFFNGQTTGAILLKGADLCAQASHSTQGSQPIVDTSPGGSTTYCLSNMQVCTWDLTEINTQPNPFTDCASKVAPKFYGQACSSPTGNFGGGAVPVCYLGWAILDNQNYKNSDHEFCEAYGGG